VIATKKTTPQRGQGPTTCLQTGRKSQKKHELQGVEETSTKHVQTKTKATKTPKVGVTRLIGKKRGWVKKLLGRTS